MAENAGQQQEGRHVGPHGIGGGHGAAGGGAPNAIEQAAAIASVPGLDMILIGTHDLTAEMGILGQFGHERFAEAMETAAAACRKHGVVMGVAGIKDLDLLGDLVALGVRFVSAGTDAGFFMEAAKAHAGRLRNVLVR